MPSVVRCGKCEATIPPGYFNLDHLTPCPRCESDLQAHVFPALFRSTSQSGAAAADASEAACFYHPENRAVVPCASCGRYLCAICETEIGGDVLCPGCIHTGVTTRKLVRLENRRILYDNVALALSTLPALMLWPTIVTAPMAIFIAIRYWNAPLSLVKRTKIRYILAIVFAVCQIGAWGFAVYILMLMRGTAK